VFGFLMAVVLSLVAHAIGVEKLFFMLQENQGLTVALVRLLGWTILINVGLFIFNLLPIPPLDGSGVLMGLLPERYLPALQQLGRYSFILFIAILLVGGQVIGLPVKWIIGVFSTIVGFPIWLAFYGG